MTLGSKTLLIISVVLALLLAVTYAISSTIMLRGSVDLEEQNSRQNIERVRDALAADLAGLNVILGDWASWDETYTFVQEANPDYVQAHLGDQKIANLKLNLMVFVNSTGRIIYGKAVDLETARETPLPESIREHIIPGSPLLHPSTNSSMTGLILLPEGPLMVASQPILTNERQGPSRGTLIVGRFLGTAEIKRLADLTHLTLSMYRVDDTQMPADVQAARPRLSKEVPTVVWSSADSIEGYTLLEDIYGNPILILRTDTPRDIYRQGQASLTILLFSLLAIGLVFGEATLFLLERLVLSRLARLSTAVSSIGTSGDLSARVPKGGRDELSRLADDINKMLAALESSQQELRNAREQLEKRVAERTKDLATAAERLTVVNHIARAASATLHLDDLMETVYREVHPLFQGNALSVALYDREAAELDFRLQVDEDVREPPVRLPLGTGLSSLVVTGKKPILVQDFAEEPDRLPQVELGGLRKPPQSWLGVPMRIGERVVGVISVQSYSPYAYGEEEQQLLSTIADQVAVAVETARLYTAMQSRADELARLNEIGLVLTSTLDFPTVVHSALSQIQRLFQAEYVSLLQCDSWTGDLRFAQTLADTGLVQTPMHPQSGEGLAGWALERHQAVLTTDAQNDPRFSRQVDHYEGRPLGALMAVPLLTPEQTIGVIEVVSRELGAYSGENLHTLQAIASTLTVALVNARLYGEIKTLLREREQAQAQLIHAEKMTALGQLVASIAHEINNPLQAVQFCLTLVEEGLESGPYSAETKGYLEAIREEVQRISTIVYRMRGFYRPAREEMQFTDLHVVLDSVLELTGRQLQYSSVAVRREWARELPMVRATPDHLKQVFLNLVLNAIDAMPSGGTLYVGTAVDQIRLENRPQPLPAVRIDFADTGAGMSADVLSHLFEPFYTTKALGSGLGLSISYGIIQAHGGQITVASEEGVGTTFSILLPEEQP